MPEISATFEQDRETRNTVRFEETVEGSDPQAMGMLYVQKWAVKELGNPTAIEVIIRPKEVK